MRFCQVELSGPDSGCATRSRQHHGKSLTFMPLIKRQLFS